MKEEDTIDQNEDLTRLTPQIHRVDIVPGGQNGWRLEPASACELRIRSRDIVHFVVDGKQTAVLTFLDTEGSNAPFGENPIVVKGNRQVASMIPPLTEKEERSFPYSIYVREAEALVRCTEPVIIMADW